MTILLAAAVPLDPSKLPARLRVPAQRYALSQTSPTAAARPLHRAMTCLQTVTTLRIGSPPISATGFCSASGRVLVQRAPSSRHRYTPTSTPSASLYELRERDRTPPARTGHAHSPRSGIYRFLTCPEGHLRAHTIRILLLRLGVIYLGVLLCIFTQSSVASSFPSPSRQRAPDRRCVRPCVETSLPHQRQRRFLFSPGTASFRLRPPVVRPTPHFQFRLQTQAASTRPQPRRGSPSSRQQTPAFVLPMGFQRTRMGRAFVRGAALDNDSSPGLDLAGLCGWARWCADRRCTCGVLVMARIGLALLPRQSPRPHLTSPSHLRVLSPRVRFHAHPRTIDEGELAAARPLSAPSSCVVDLDVRRPGDDLDDQDGDGDDDDMPHRASRCYTLTVERLVQRYR